MGVDCFTNYYAESLKLNNISKLGKNRSFKLFRYDLSRANLARLPEPDVVFHLSAQPGVRASWGTSFSYYVSDNIVATQRLLEAARAWNLESFVYSSSSSVYGDAEQLPTKESALPRPVSPYRATKLAGEHLCHVYFRNYQLPTVTLRYFTVFWPRQRPDMAFCRFIDCIRRGRPIELFGDGSQERDYTFVGDTVKGTILASGAPPGETYNVGTGRSVPLSRIKTLLESLLGKKARTKLGAVARGDVVRTYADISNLSDAVGYRPVVELEEGLKEQVDATLSSKRTLRR